MRGAPRRWGAGGDFAFRYFGVTFQHRPHPMETEVSRLTDVTQERSQNGDQTDVLNPRAKLFLSRIQLIHSLHTAQSL